MLDIGVAVCKRFPERRLTRMPIAKHVQTVILGSNTQTGIGNMLDMHATALALTRAKRTHCDMC